MNLREYAELTATRAFAALDISPDDTRRVAVVDIIERQLIATAVDTRNWCADHVVSDRKIEHETRQQVSEHLRSATEALIANLSSMR
jgi:hypothetical protein